MYEGGDNKAVTAGVTGRPSGSLYMQSCLAIARPREVIGAISPCEYTLRGLLRRLPPRYASQWQGPSASPGAEGPTWKSDDDARQLRCVQIEERLRTTHSLTEALSHADPTYSDLMADIDRLSEELAEVRESRM